MGDEVLLLLRLQLGLGLLLIGRLKEVGQLLRDLEELWGYGRNVLKVIILHCIMIVGNLLYHCSGHCLIQNLGLHYI